MIIPHKPHHTPFPARSIRSTLVREGFSLLQQRYGKARMHTLFMEQEQERVVGGGSRVACGRPVCFPPGVSYQAPPPATLPCELVVLAGHTTCDLILSRNSQPTGTRLPCLLAETLVHFLADYWIFVCGVGTGNSGGSDGEDEGGEFLDLQQALTCAWDSFPEFQHMCGALLQDIRTRQVPVQHLLEQVMLARCTHMYI